MSDQQKIIELESLVARLAHEFSTLASGATNHGRRLNVQGAQIASGISVAAATDEGDTSFMILSCALVLLMTIPGLGLYYSGMVRVQNVLSTVMQSFAITCIITVVWLFWGYSLAFGPSNMKGALNPDGGYNGPDGTTDGFFKTGAHSSPMIGDGSRLWLMGLNVGSVHYLAPTIPESVFCVFQLTFAIITCALICGSFADRMKFSSMLVFMVLWHTIVYCPIAHWNWHQDGFLNRTGNMDFAGGNVVHISSGVAGLMSTIVVGNRKGFGKERFEPHNILLTFFGASLLWVGWYGFNAGSAGAANTQAGIAMLNTQIATSMSALTWMATEWIVRKQPSVLGMLSGAIAGLVAITPACGFVDPTGGFFIGFIAGPVCFYGAQLKKSLGYDDALDAFGVHAIGGITGGILIGFFATDQYTFKNSGVFYGGGGKQLSYQIYGIVVTIAWSALFSFLILKGLDLTMGLRVTAEEEEAGLDSSLHGESIVVEESPLKLDEA